MLVTASDETFTGLSPIMRITARFAFWPVFAVCLIAGLVPIWWVSQLPTVDGSVHLYIVHLLDRLGQGGNFDGIFRRNYTLEPNLTVYGVLWLFSRVMPLATAEKLVISLYWLLFAGSALYLATAMGRRGIVAGLLALPFALGYYLHWGFYNFILSLALFVPVSAYALRRLDHLRWRHLLVLSAGMLALAFTHLVGAAMAMFFIGMARTGFALRDGLSRKEPGRWTQCLTALFRDGLLILLAALPALVLIGSFLLRRVAGDDMAAPEMGLLQKLVYIGSLSPIFGLDQRELIALGAFILVFWATAARLFWIFWRDRESAIAALPVLLPPAVLGFILLIGSLGFSGFDALPRLLPFLLLMLIPAFGLLPPNRIWNAATMIAVAGGLVALAFVHVQFYQRIDALYQGYATARSAVPPGSAVLAFNTTEKQKEVEGYPTGWRMNVTAHFGERYAREHDLALLNVDMLEPDVFGYFPINYQPEAKLAASWRGKLYMPPSQPLRDFEAKTGIPIAEVAIWPTDIVPGKEYGSINLDRIPLLRSELDNDWRPHPPRSSMAPLIYTKIQAGQ